MNPIKNQIRIDQTYQGYLYFRERVDRWFSDRKKADQALEKRSTQVNGLSPMQDRGEVYRFCTAYDQYLLWVQRIWEYHRFDQRDQPDLKNVLAAADEIVWSCFHGMFPDPLPGAPTDAPYRPAPLPYIVPDYSPRVVDKPSAELQAAAEMPEEFQKGWMPT